MTITAGNMAAMAATNEYAKALSEMEQFEQYIDEAAGKAKAITDDGTRTPESKREKLKELRTGVIDEARASRDRIADLLKSAEARAAKGIAGQQDDPVLETRKARAAGRVNRLLDAGQGFTEAAQVFAESEDLDALRVLRDELPSYVAMKIKEPLDRPAKLRELSLALDRAMHPLLPTTEQHAVEVRLGITDAESVLDGLMHYAVHFDQLGGNDRVQIAREIAAIRPSI